MAQTSDAIPRVILLGRLCLYGNAAARFGEGLLPMNIARVARRDPLTRSRFRPAGEPPFGLFGDGTDDELADFFGTTFKRVELGARSLRDDLRHDVFGLF